MAINQAQLVDLLTEYRRENWRGIQTPEWQREIVRGVAEESEPRILSRIAAHWELPYDPLILDLGSGVGNFVVACRMRGLRAFGVEPDRIGQGSSITSLQIAGKRTQSGAFAAATGEQLPFPDAIFDLIVLDQVIEHVQSQKAVLAEALRVLKPAGAIYLACPNYLRFYEPHYKVAFLPLIPKFLGAFYLRLRGRDPVLLRQLTYTTNWRIRKLLRQFQACFIDLNESGFLAKCVGQKVRASTRRARVVQTLTRLPILSRFTLLLASVYIRVREGGSEFVVFRRA
ncbi:MAG TPA: class I SAM-dependent methyltransferase [Terriglobales bacterium]|nr:class I SAM-dependent methyltransferase [Terriglobales bacterium]